jgi:hypothetical protein
MGTQLLVRHAVYLQEWRGDGEIVMGTNEERLRKKREMEEEQRGEGRR